LALSQSGLACSSGHEFPIEQGIPVFARRPRREAVPSNMAPLATRPHVPVVDAFVDDWIVNTNGNLYWQARGNLKRYPIPNWPTSPGNGKLLLDVGCSWGRWTFAAARAGFSPIGVDIHLDALCAADRVARNLNASADFICCDADFLPFRSESFDFVFSYSVLQHIAKKNVRRILKEIARVLREGGVSYVQLPNTYGLVSLGRQARRRFSEPSEETMEMRYWTHAAISSAFREAGLGAIRIHADGFFLQNTQLADWDVMSPLGKAAVLVSASARAVANRVPLLTRLADSLWVEARKDRCD